MKQIFTCNHLISYYYQETPILENTFETFFEDISENALLKAEIKKGLQMLPKVTFSPRKTTLDAILNYSRISKLETL